MNFILIIILITGLQRTNKYLLQKVIPNHCHKVLSTVLVGIHIPLILYAIVKLTGKTAYFRWLQPLVRFSVYFQLVTFITLVSYIILYALSFLVRILFNRVNNNGLRNKLIISSIVIGVVLSIFCICYGQKEAKSVPKVVYQEMKFANLPIGLDGLRIVHISDLHSGPMVSSERIKQWRLIIEKERPELLLITGDLVDSLPGEAQAIANAFNGIKLPLGCFAILGNHDYFTNPQPIWQILANSNIRFLENNNAIVSRNGDQLAVIGLQDRTASAKYNMSHKQYGLGPQPVTAINSIPDRAWRICLLHQPRDWSLAKQMGANLTLAGHTHGGQVNLIPGLSSARLLGKYTYGMYTEGQYSLYVNRGLGTAIIPLRISAPPEIVVITLKQA